MEPDGSAWRGKPLSAQRNLFDPVWGGVYQYSTDGDWKHPHYEKLLQFQAENLRIYSLAYARWGDPQYLDDARQIRRYMQDFLTSPEGVFYTSQDADLVPGEHSEGYFALSDHERRQQGNSSRRYPYLFTRERMGDPGPCHSLRGHRRARNPAAMQLSRQIGSSNTAPCPREDFRMTRRTAPVPTLVTLYSWATPS